LIRLSAPAKLTLSLKVTGIRPDGYHELDAEMVSLSLADELLLRDVALPAGTDRPHIEISMRDCLGVGTLAVSEDPEQNLIGRALKLVGRGARVEVLKRIPPGGGLGGGSADAACILRWAGWLAEYEKGRPVLERAASLGADVPFCLLGGHGVVRGIGEQIELLEPLERWFALLIPPFGISTAEVYRAWDELARQERDSSESEARNDLKRAALLVEPRLASWAEALGTRTGKDPILAGSGASWFVELQSKDAEGCLQELSLGPNDEAIHLEGCPAWKIHWGGQQGLLLLCTTSPPFLARPRCQTPQ
jgi:4-diphosphocytidyl-2-C-methyl-D-erythritol kinase